MLNIALGFLGRNAGRMLGAAGVALVLGLAVRWAANAQYERGFTDARSQCQQAVVDEYERLLRDSSDAIRAAHAQSQTINRALAERQRASEKTAKDLRDALSATQTERAHCVFDADSLRHVEAARTRAAQSVVTGFHADTGGVDGAVSAAGGDDE